MADVSPVNYLVPELGGQRKQGGSSAQGEAV